ncbi:MAG: alpha-E domain-containing protein [Bacteroidota bacterium]|nr:alpha-E domain-containing protein [Bacteroidota bacterium]
MLSRIADSIFWLSRYMERSDGLLRSTQTHYILMLDKGVNEHLSWEPVLQIFTNKNNSELSLLKHNTEYALQALLLDINNPNALKVMIHRARENARGVQDHITKEVWEQVNQLYHLINQPLSLQGFEAIETIERLSTECILYNGVADTTMPRGMGWSFMSLGRHIERCLLTIEMTDLYFGQVAYQLDNEKDILQWRPLLLSLSGYELHLKTYRTGTHNLNALHQVLFNVNFTRSVLYTLKRIDKYFQLIIEHDTSAEIQTLTKQLGRLLSKVEYTDFNSLNALTLQSYLKEIRKELLQFSNQLAQHFFSYA